VPPAGRMQSGRSDFRSQLMVDDQVLRVRSAVLARVKHVIRSNRERGRCAAK
jgi:hypothetical protein